MANRWGNSVRLYFLGFQNHCRWWLQPWNQKTLTPWKESYDYSAAAAAAAAKSLQSCLTLCDPIDGSPPGSPVPGILQARSLEWVAISFSNAWKWKVKVKSLSRVRLFETPWTAAYQAAPSKGFSRQEYWSRVPLPSPINNFRFIYLWEKAFPALPSLKYLSQKSFIVLSFTFRFLLHLKLRQIQFEAYIKFLFFPIRVYFWLSIII